MFSLVDLFVFRSERMQPVVSPKQSEALLSFNHDCCVDSKPGGNGGNGIDSGGDHTKLIRELATNNNNMEKRVTENGGTKIPTAASRFANFRSNSITSSDSGSPRRLLVSSVVFRSYISREHWVKVIRTSVIN